MTVCPDLTFWYSPFLENSTSQSFTSLVNPNCTHISYTELNSNYRLYSTQHTGSKVTRTCTGHKLPARRDGRTCVGALQGRDAGQLVPFHRPHSEAVRSVGHDELASGSNVQIKDTCRGKLHKKMTCNVNGSNVHNYLKDTRLVV